MSASIPSWARVGAKVVCVETWVDDNPILAGPIVGPVAGQTYTLGEVDVVDPWGRTGPYVRLVELNNPAYWHSLRGIRAQYEAAFYLRRFRPLVSDSDELGIEAQFNRKAGRKFKAPVRESERA